MPAESFNGTVVTFDPDDVSGGVTPVSPYRLYVKSWSTSGGTRPEVDVTTTENVTRKSIPGMPGPEEVSFECLFQPDQTQDPVDTSAQFKAKLDLWRKSCAKGFLKISVPIDCETPQGQNTSFSSSAHVKNVEFTGELDQAYTFNITFLVVA